MEDRTNNSIMDNRGVIQYYIVTYGINLFVSKYFIEVCALITKTNFKYNLNPKRTISRFSTIILN